VNRTGEADAARPGETEDAARPGETEAERDDRKEQLVKDANILAIAGLAAVGLDISAAVLLVVSYVDRGATVVLITLFVVCLFAVLWFVLPLARSRTRFPSQQCIDQPEGGSERRWQ